MSSRKINFRELFNDLVAGTMGGFALALVGQPLDTIKVRMQTQSKSNQLFKGPMDCFVKTVKNEGVFGLYKGVASPMIGSGLLFSLCFASYGFGKRTVAGTEDPSKMSALQIFGAGLFGGTLPTLIMTPMERIKVLLQVEYGTGGNKKYSGVIDCARKIGFRGMYQGTMSTLYRDMPGSGFYYMSYELFLRGMAKRMGKTRNDLNASHFMVAGGLAGMSAWVYMIFPDTIKSRIQAAEAGTYRNFAHACVTTIKQEGFGIFFKGLGPIFLRSFPANAACFVAYEYAMKVMKRYNSGKK